MSAAVVEAVERGQRLHASARAVWRVHTHGTADPARKRDILFDR
jgi:hypothetical protein